MIVASIFAHRYKRWAGCDYHATLRVLNASCRRLGLRHVVISDCEVPGIETAVFDLPENLMQLLVDGQRQLLETVDEPVLLVGADCIVTRDPAPIFAGDLVVTLGPFADCEMNTGAIFCANPRRCAPVWKAALDAGPKAWGDDQRALYAAIQASDLDWRSVRCEAHNWAPEHPEDRAGMPTVVHFRGNRKAWMADWGRRYLGLHA